MKRKSKYKSKILKQRKKRLFQALDESFDELNEALKVSRDQMKSTAEQIIETSPHYLEINHLCTKVIPLFEDFSPCAIAFDTETERLLYTFTSEAEWNRVKEFYRDWFTKQGWQLTDNGENLPRLDKIAFEKGKFKIVLCDSSFIDGYLLIGGKSQSNEIPLDK